MNVHAHLRYLRLSPRKVRLVADAIRGLDVDAAEHLLLFQSKWAAQPLLKLLRSAIANAKQNHQLDRATLMVKTIIVNQGPTLKRFRPRAQGRAFAIHKPMTHVTVVVENREA